MSGSTVAADDLSAIRLDVLCVEADGHHPQSDWVSTEVPLEVRLNGQAFAVMMVTPNDLEDFAYGFARSELGLQTTTAVVGIAVQEQLEGWILELTTSGATCRELDPRWLPGRSGCGICGSRRLEDVLQPPAPVLGQGVLRREVLEQALATLRAAQAMGQRTGALHAAAWFSLQAELILVREDIGRHNALDKLLGALWRREQAMDQGFLLVTSRASYEMVTKAASAGVSIMAAISAPTALAVRLADSCGMSLLGFARPGRCLIYTHRHRFRDDGQIRSP